MPTLAREILQKNNQASNVKLNFKGLIVGNPFTGKQSEVKTLLDDLVNDFKFVWDNDIYR